MASVSDFIELSPDEIIVKEYRSFRMKKPQNATVNIAATNMRLILYGQSSRGRKSGRPTLTQEIRIEDIRGVEIYEKEKPKIILATIGLFFLASAALLALNRLPSVYRAVESMTGNGSFGTVAAAVPGVVLLLSAFVFRNREFEIIVKGNSSNLNTGMFSEKTVFKEGIDSPRILRELGSIIIQIQKDREKFRREYLNNYEKEPAYSYESRRMESFARDISEEYEKDSLFEVEEHRETDGPADIPKTRDNNYGHYSSVISGAAEEQEEDKFPEQEEEKREQEEAGLSETDEDSEDEMPEEEIEVEEYDGPRDKVNVDDILQTMQNIKNPTNKR